jgi:superfamily II DNA or RNA helicase
VRKNVITSALSAMFYSSLHFAIVNSNYCNIILKPKQVKCLEAIYFGRDVVTVLPTGYGKSRYGLRKVTEIFCPRFFTTI